VLRDTGKGSGELVIRYQTFEQLDALCSRLTKTAPAAEEKAQEKPAQW
jgi:hypothetical protein